MNQRGLDQGWGCVVERGQCRKKGACLGSNSSHLERLMDRGWHFCTCSLPPHSIIRHSIKSSKKEDRKKKNILVQECEYSLLLLLSQHVVGFVQTCFRVDSYKRKGLFSPTNLFWGQLCLKQTELFVLAGGGDVGLINTIRISEKYPPVFFF